MGHDGVGAGKVTMGGRIDALRRMAQRTPPSRERVVDLLRAVAIIAVVLGHWLVSEVGYDARGRVTAGSALPDLPWAHPLTWLVQVMPLFFLVGGYANAASLTAHTSRGGDVGGWLLNRGARLIRPTTALIVVLAAGAFAARLLGVDPELVRLAVWFACIPLWFLSVYLIVVVATPVMWALHRRYGLLVPAGLVLLVGIGDAARILGGEPWAYGSFLFGWLAIHQMGIVWRDGRLPSGPRVAVPLLLGGLSLLLLLTLAGPYPVSMINIPGERLHNMSPPSLALLSLAAAQLGLVLLLRGRLDRWLHRTRPWLFVVGVNAVILTIFLWHISAAILVTALMHAIGRLPEFTVGSGAWLLWRIPWLLMLTVALAALVAQFGPIEARSGRAEAGPASTRAGLRLALVLAGFAAVTFGLIVNNMYPSRSPAAFGVPTTALVAYLAGAALLRLLAGRRRS